MTEATYVITSGLALTGEFLAWAEPIFNPLHADATILTYFIDLGLVIPVGFGVIKRLLGLARGRRR